MKCLFVLASLLLAAACHAKEVILEPKITTGLPVGIVVLGRKDMTPYAYNSLSQQIQSTLGSAKVSAWIVMRDTTDGLDETVAELQQKHSWSNTFYIGHSMDDGAVTAQHFVKENPIRASGLILIAGFLQRIHRPDVVECLPKAAIKPRQDLKCLLGCLDDGVHDCNGDNVVDFPIPTLSIGGDLDGVVRVTRMAEAYFTQKVLTRDDNLPVVVVEGLNHAVLLDGDLPKSISSKDLRAELEAADAMTVVANLVADFMLDKCSGEYMPSGALKKAQMSSEAFFKPIIEAFVEQEGNWFFTGFDDEHGYSAWAAEAQRLMAEPMPTDYTFKTDNEFHLLTDEDKIPPYFRNKHRPQINVTSSSSVSTSTVTQLRFIELSVTETKIGLDGWAIIKEEKLNILTAIPDNGAGYSSAIEIATKLASRQLVYNLTGQVPAPDSLDDGNRCMDINQKAYDWALAKLTDHQGARFAKHGIPMVMKADKKPNPPAGPWWIYGYMQYDKTAEAMGVTSLYAFYSTSANPYGAGNHYCKLLSPARALEWALIDGLRDNYAVQQD